MEKQVANQRRRGEDGSMDRISELPQPMLHHILCYLTQNDAVRTCVLSKPWRDLGITRPKIDFRYLEITLIPKNDDKFMFLVDRTLHRYQDRKLTIHEFVLAMFPNYPRLVIEEWILLVLHRGVKIFNLKFYLVPYFSLPSVIFQAESLEELHLANCMCLNPIDKVLLKNLRTLFFEFVNIEENILHQILSSCPLIEKVVLRRCPNLLNTIHLNEVRNLKHFDFECRVDLETFRIEFNSQTLETIHIVDYRNWNHHNLYFTHLKSLCLTRVWFPKRSFNIFSCNFPCLVELELLYCKGFKGFQLSSPSIKRLTIMDSRNSIEAYQIDAPNILYFEFSGDSPPSPFSFTTTSKEWKSRIHLTLRVDLKKELDFSTWFLKLNEMFKALSQSQISLDLFCINNRRGKIFKDRYCGTYELVHLEHLIASEGLLSTNLQESLNFVFGTCRPRYIIDLFYYVDTESESQREHNGKVDSLCKILHNKREGIRQPCLWKNDLKEVTLETFDENAKEWCLVQGTSFSECSLPKKKSEQKNRIRLKWRES